MKFYWIKILIILLILTSCIKQKESKLYSKSWTDSDRMYLKENLKKSVDLILNEVKPLTEDQINWKADENEWSIAFILEHLITHDELFYREVRVLSDLPEMNIQNDSLFEEDMGILSYAKVTTENIGKSPAYLEPLGKWCKKQDAIEAYERIRGFLISFVEITDKDLRKYYTTSGRGATKFRDLHQLLLISVSHTRRHLVQIQKIKNDNNFRTY